MSLYWPSDRMSRRGLADFFVAAAALPFGIWMLHRAGAPPAAVRGSLMLVGFLALVACGFCVFRIVRRGEYPWIVALAAIALPLFQPASAPYGVVDRVVFALRDLVLVGATIVFVVRGIRRGDELERRTHLQALSWSYAIVIAGLVCLAFVEDVLPPVRGTWIASAMLAIWFVAWVAASIRYQQ